jgi:hypothetical protein
MTNTNPLIQEHPAHTANAIAAVLHFVWGSEHDGIDGETHEAGRGWIMAVAIGALEHQAAQLADAAKSQAAPIGAWPKLLTVEQGGRAARPFLRLYTLTNQCASPSVSVTPKRQAVHAAA